MTVFDSMFAAETDTALRARAAAPPPPPAGVGIFDGFWGSVFRAPAAAVLEMGDTVERNAGPSLDLQMRARTGALPRLDRAAEKQRQDVAELTGRDVRVESPIAQAVRESLTPDPVTTGAAGQVAFGLVNLLTKAAIFGAAGGPVFGAAATGLMEGGAESGRLQAQGVDSDVAFQAGAVRAAATGVSLAAPIAGQTLMRSLGIVAATGPGTFMAEQQAIRTILDNADYKDIAGQYDPTDTAGLLLSTVAPGVFAAAVHGIRGARARRAPAAAPVAPAAARSEPPPLITPEAVEAARVLSAKAAVEDQVLVRGDARLEAQEGHQRALDAVEDQVARGEVVALRDAPADVAVVREVETAVAARIQAARAEVVAALDEAAGPVRQPVRAEGGTIPAEPTPGGDIAARPEPGMQRGAPDDPETAAARQMVDRSPELEIAIETGQDGEVVRLSAREALEQADADVVQAELDARAFDAAVVCYLGGGA